VAVFPDQLGFCVGSVEGRVAIEHIEDSDLPKNFAFKCHRHNADSKVISHNVFIGLSLKVKSPTKVLTYYSLLLLKTLS
jgi:hypothetical protein